MLFVHNCRENGPKRFAQAANAEQNSIDGLRFIEQ